MTDRAKEASKELSEIDVQQLITDWDLATGPHRAHMALRPRTGSVCPACSGTGEIGYDNRRYSCLRCNGRGVDPLP
jgi:DnaJ-class molecular chaperone